MAINYDKERGTYFITYYYKDRYGNKKLRKLRNKEWTKKRWLQQNEYSLIEEDKEKLRQNDIVLDNKYPTLKKIFLKSLELEHKPQSIYNATLLMNKYIDPEILKYSNLETAFSPANIVAITENIRNRVYAFTELPNQFNKCVFILRMLYDKAFTLDFISSLVYSKGKLLLVKDKKKVLKKETIKVWTPEQVEIFLNTFNEVDQKWKMYFELSYWCGLRIGEALALTWKDFDENKKTLHITKQLDRDGSVATTKTVSSVGFIHIRSEVAEHLIEFKKSYKNPSDDKYIFFVEHTSRTTVRRVMSEHISMTNLPRISPHGLRHSISSRMANKEIPELFISLHLRHSNGSNTTKNYIHAFNQDERLQQIVDSL